MSSGDDNKQCKDNRNMYIVFVLIVFVVVFFRMKKDEE